MAENQVICIARQFGSGGREVGVAVAQALGYRFYDKELLRAAADKSGIMEELFEKNDERPASGLRYAVAGDAAIKAASFSDYIGFMPNDQMQNIIAEVIREAADEAPCVIIGRCADYVLRGREKVVSVFIHAPLETRIQRIARLHNLDEDGARALIRKTDRSRANYYSYYTDRDWGAASNYDFCLDAGRIGIEKATALVEQAAKMLGA